MMPDGLCEISVPCFAPRLMNESLGRNQTKGFSLATEAPLPNFSRRDFLDERGGFEMTRSRLNPTPAVSLWGLSTVSTSTKLSFLSLLTGVS